MQDQFIYPMLMTYGTSTTGIQVFTEFKNGIGGGDVLPSSSERIPMVNTNGKGGLIQGLYYWNGKFWAFLLPYEVICASIIDGADIEIRTLLTGTFDFSLPGYSVSLYHNGSLQSNLQIINSRPEDVWTVVKLSLGSSGTGDVKTVSGQSPDSNGNVVIGATDGTSATGDTLIINGGQNTGSILLKTLVAGSNVTVADDGTGENIVISATAAPYTLPVATSSVLGGVKQGTGVTIAGDGTLSVTAIGGVSSFNTRTGDITLLLNDITDAGGAPTDSPNLTGTPTSTTPNSGDSSTRIATTEYVTDAIANGAQGSITEFEFVATEGQTSFAATFSSGAFVEVFQNGALLFSDDYNKNGTGPVVLNYPASADDEIKILATTPFNVANTVPVTGGTYTGNVFGNTPSVGDNSNQFATTEYVYDVTQGQAEVPLTNADVTLTPEQYSASVIRLQGTLEANVTVTFPITGSWVVINDTFGSYTVTLTNTGGYSLLAPQAEATGIVADSTVGILSYSGSGGGGSVTSVSGQTGTVVVEATDNNAATGTSLISDSGASTGNIKLKTLVAGSGVTVSPDVNGNLQISASVSGVSSFNTRTGAVTLQLSDVTGVGGAPLASPAFTGIPTVPTATAGTNTTQAASTAFVQAAVSNVPTYTLPVATTTVLGGVKQGSNVTIAASVLASMMPGVSDSWTTPFWCADSNGNWAWVNHNATQIQQVGQDGKTAILGYQSKNASLQTQVQAATTVDQVAAIVWPAS